MCTLREHDIDTCDAPPIFIPPYRKSRIEREILNTMVKEMLDAKVIVESKSPWSAPVVLIPKHDGSKRFCIDYRKLNIVTKTEYWPMPNIKEIFDNFSGSKYFTKIDIKNAFWQLKLSSRSREKTGFSTPDGHYQWNVMPFGLKNAPQDYCKLMHQIFGSKKFVEIFLDDLAVHSKTLEEHFDFVIYVLDALKMSGQN